MIIVTALIALVQIDALRSGSPSPLTIAGTTAAALVENPASAIVNAIRGSLTTLRDLPHLQRENWDLAARNAVLARRNARLEELANAYAQQVVLAPQIRQYAHAVEARVIGYPPENAILAVTIDRGTKAGIRRHDGVLAAGGVVGRISQAGPYTSTVRLITDYTSRIPAVVRRGRWWGIARGNLTSVRLQYVSQDAPLR
ncbi:MAG: rod shape-determining protein MreC, partial [Vulcanimicrobiaceae bacterium]